MTRMNQGLHLKLSRISRLEAGVVTLQDQFSCPGFRVVEDRRIHCARRTGHGAQTLYREFKIPVIRFLLMWHLRLGVEKYYDYFQKIRFIGKNRY